MNSTELVKTPAKTAYLVLELLSCRLTVALNASRMRNISTRPYRTSKISATFHRPRL